MTSGQQSLDCSAQTIKTVLVEDGGGGEPPSDHRSSVVTVPFTIGDELAFTSNVPLIYTQNYVSVSLLLFGYLAHTKFCG